MGSKKKSTGGYFFVIIIIVVCIGVPSIRNSIKAVFSGNALLPETTVPNTVQTPEGDPLPVFQSFDEAVAYRNKRFSDDERGRLNNKFKADGTSGDPYFDAAQSYIVKSSQRTAATQRTPSQKTPVAATTSAPTQRTDGVAVDVASRNNGVSSNQRESSSQRYSPYIPEPAVIMYYGADIGLFPPKVRNWIVKEGFTKDKMEGNGKIDPQLRAWWSNDGNSVSFEASYIVAAGYVGAGTRKTWGTGSSYSGGNLQNYGQYAKYKTLKFEYDLKREVEYLIAHDPAYTEVINFAKKLCSEIEYDWANFSAYRGARPIRNSGMRYAVCDGYSNEVMDKALLLHCVKSVEKWTGPNHAWNVINLVDGRTLYFDLTWFDNEHIHEKTGQIYQTDDYDWENITFNEDLFRHSNVGYGTGTFSHDQNKFNRIVGKT
jgi:hypothetical protein